MPSSQGTGEWGGGFLDNLRRNCGMIAMWTVQLDAAAPPNTGIETMFYSQFCTLQDVQDAAYTASEPTNRIILHCEFLQGDRGVVLIDG